MTWLDDAQKSHESQLQPNEVPVLFKDAKITDVKTSVVRRVAADYMMRFWELAEVGKAPAFLGRAGTYKTYAAALIANGVRSARIDVAFVQCGPEFTRLERRRFDAATDARIEWLGECPFVVFDDFTKLKPGSFGLDTLDAIVETRYGNRLPTCYTGNVVVKAGDFSEIAAQFGAGFTRRLQEGAAGLTVVVK